MKTLASFLGLLAILGLYAPSAVAQDAACAEWLNHEVVKLNSTEVIDLCEETAGKPVLLVNTASYCGFTYQFTGLETLYQQFRDEGLVVIGFPSDDFNQEDDDSSKTAEVCYINHGVTFVMTDVVQVKGDTAHPVFAHLGSETEPPSWNFNKYLVSRDGRVVAHFDSRVEPDSGQLIAAIQGQL